MRDSLEFARQIGQMDESIVVANELVREETAAAVEVDDEDDGVVIPDAEDLAP